MDVCVHSVGGVYQEMHLETFLCIQTFYKSYEHFGNFCVHTSQDNFTQVFINEALGP